MKQIVTITTVIILVVLSQGCRHRIEHLEPYGWPLVDARFDSLTRVAEQYMYSNVPLDSVDVVTRQMDSIARSSADDSNELLARTHYWEAYRLLMSLNQDIAGNILDTADSLATDPYTKARIYSLKNYLVNYKSYDTFCNLLRQLEYYASIGDLPEEGNTAMQICSSLMYTEVPDLALHYLNMADSLYSLSGNSRRSENMQINKANLLCIANRPDEAEEVFNRLFSDSTLINNKEVYELLLRNHYYFFEDSASLFNAYAVRRSIEIDSRQSRALTALYEALIGEYYFNKGMMDSAFTYLGNDRINPESIPDEDLQQAIYEIYANYYEALGDKDKAIAAISKLKDIQKEIQEDQQPDNKIYTDFMNAKQQIQAEAREENSQLRIKLYTTIALAALLVSVVLIAWRKWYKRYRLKQQATARRAEQRERELMSMALTRQQGDRIIDYVGNEISRLSNQEEITGKDISQLDKNLKLHMLERENMQNFEKTFTKIHPDFYSNLRTITPDLSDNQIRLCSYIMLGLNNQEIASLMNIKQSSLRQARLRLRQKFGITKDDSIQEFLQQITPPRKITA
ncbi:MAG: hypothetical protein K2G40_08330 [Muribaculaceae bacterium]|nr:hypothetical protein [Muribaculaceae bacterium]